MVDLPLGQTLDKARGAASAKRPITLADQEAFRRLGAGTDTRPELFSTYTPVVVFGDVSQLIPVPQPARGLASFSHSYAVGSHARFAIQSEAPGGVRVNQVLLAATNSIGASVIGVWDMQRGTGSAGLTQRVVLNLGQDADPSIVSTFHSDVVLDPPPTGGVVIQPFVEFFVGTIPLNIFVPRGSFMLWSFESTVATIASVAIFWNELELVSRSPL